LQFWLRGDINFTHRAAARHTPKLALFHQLNKRSSMLQAHNNARELMLHAPDRHAHHPLTSIDAPAAISQPHGDSRLFAQYMRRVQISSFDKLPVIETRQREKRSDRSPLAQDGFRSAEQPPRH
jgi:hypothetical protein